ncbi:CoA transferase [Cutibacterium acnes]
MSKGVLEGVKVLDLSRVLAGPYCGAFLADLGADVVKVEAPNGDDARHLGPFKGEESVYFAELNHGKRSVVLNFKDPKDHERFMKLVEHADVVLENFRPGVTKRLGVDAESVHKTNPRIIYASISGFGQEGPFRNRLAYDLIVQAMSGIMAATGPEGGKPTRVGESLGDVVSGIFAGWAICAALYERERTGVGRTVDVSMFNSLLALQVTNLSLLLADGKLPGRIGNRHPVSVPFDTYPAKDGLVALAVANDRIWARLADLMGRPDLGANDAYLGDMNRANKRQELTQLVSGWTQTMTVAELLRKTEEAGVPAAPIWDLKEALESEHVVARHSLGHFTHPELGKMPYLRFPADFGCGNLEVSSESSPRLGEQTAGAVAAEWGRSANDDK